MIVGAEVGHISKDSDSTTPSMAGVVATCDEGSGQYLASARPQYNSKKVCPLNSPWMNITKVPS